MNWILTFTILTFELVSSKAFNINDVLRIQMARIAHQYEMQKNIHSGSKRHQLKDKDTLELIKMDLKSDFQKSKNEMIRKLKRQQAQSRRKSIKTGLVRTKRSFIDEAIDLDLKLILRSQIEKFTKETDQWVQ